VLLDNLAGAVGNDMPDAAHRLGIYIPWEYVFADAAVTGTTAARRGSPRGSVVGTVCRNRAEC